MDDHWLPINQIAEHLGISKDTVYTWVNDKGMPGYKVGRFWKFKKEEVNSWVRAGGAAFPNDEEDDQTTSQSNESAMRAPHDSSE